MDTLRLRYFDTIAYQTSWQAMRAFTTGRTVETPDELWILEHPPVYTLGQAGKAEHILNPHQIPVVKCDRGGQVTYHGPGQTVIYLLIDLHRKNLGVRELVSNIESAIMSFLESVGLSPHLKEGAPGVYIEHRKIASLGLRIRQGRSYHGLALNRAMDLSPFLGINPCGYANQAMTSLEQEKASAHRKSTEDSLVQLLQQHLNLGLATEVSSTLPPQVDIECYNHAPTQRLSEDSK